MTETLRNVWSRFLDVEGDMVYMNYVMNRDLEYYLPYYLF